VLAPHLLPAADLDLPGLLAQVARPEADTIGFVEVRYSRLLKTPLAVSGTLEHAADGTLVRRVEVPYHERTEIRGNDVVIEREGSRSRRFSLDRVPELQGLLGSIGAMLRGDATLLDRYFSATLDGTLDAWQVLLVPNDPRLGQRLANIAIDGTRQGARCFIMNQPTGDASIIALGVSSVEQVPHGARADFESWCAAAGRHGP
jgi:Outer membrane lipoprotein carrier protein LolA-like